MFGLDYLLSPFSTQEFIESHWGKRAAYIPGEDNKFRGLYGWNTVNDLLFASRNHSGLRLVHEKKSLASSEFKNLDDWLEKGATLVVNGVNQVDPVVAKFQEVLSYELNTHVNINSYMSYPAKQGFDTHFDFHDVFIIQTVGVKEWHIYEPTRTFPLHSQPDQDKGDPPEGDPYLECTLSPGDVVYIPRGHWHYAVAAEPSIHLTVGPESRSGSELLNWWSKRLMEGDEFFRKDFPVIRSAMMGGDHDGTAYRAHMDEFRSRMKALFDDETFMDELVTRYCMLRNPLQREFNLPFAWDEVNGIREETNLSVRENQKFVVHYDDEKQSVLLVLRGTELEIEGIPKLVLADILSAQGSTTICGQDLLGKYPDLQWDSLRDWLTQMYRAGLLARSD